MAKFKFLDKVWDIGADIIDLIDEVCIEFEELIEAGFKGSIYVGAWIVDVYDGTASLVEWFILKTLVHAGRRLHDMRVWTIKNKAGLLKDALILGVGCIIMITVFSWATDYEYSYNGRALGIVKEQRDVLEILDLASEELSQQYGSTIEIDPDTDITFRPVVSYGKEIDTEDDVLRRLTYMGEINAKATAIMADGQLVVVVENDEVAEEVLQQVKDMYVVASSSTQYEYVGFVQEITIEEYSTKLTNIMNKTAAIEKIRSGGQQATEYTVQNGDTISGICEKLGITMSELQELNPGVDDETVIHAGDTFAVERQIPLLTVETVEVSTYAETIPYETEYKDSSYYYEGESVVSRSGSDGKASVTARITKRNGSTVDSEILNTEVLTQPVSEIILKGTKVVPPKTGTGTFIRPVNVSIYSGYGYRWGRMHNGIDLSASTGTPIKAADGGTVTLSGWYYGYGYTVIIDHGNNTKTLYGHCSELYVSVGEKVYQGQTIAAVGNTGNSTGPHCHFEIIINGSNVNPAAYV